MVPKIHAIALFLTISVSATGFTQIQRDAPQYTPVVDGILSDLETSSQLAVPMVWPIDTGALLLEGSGFSEEEISATWYVSWDANHLNLSANVLDNSPIYRNPSPGPYNGQDTIQPTFNPFNNEDHFFQDPIPAEDEVVDEVAAIYDLVIDTADGFGPDIYRHGHLMDEDEHDAISIAGTTTEGGYILEAAIPWSVAMDDVAPDYVPSVDDIHGLGFILLSFNEEDGNTAEIATLMTDFGEGVNTIADPSTWNSIKLVGPKAALGDFDANGSLDASDIDALSQAVIAMSTDLTFDLDGDSSVTDSDRSVWIKDLRNTWVGDSNLDGEFNSSDFVQVFTAGLFETNQPATWEQGDWNGDGTFNSSDFVASFTDGGFEMGPRTASQSVPEPSAIAMTFCGLLAFFQRRRTR